MKIFGIGTDIVNIKRMEKSLKQYGSKFKNNIFSKRAEQLKISEFIWLANEIKKINHEILPN